VAKKKTKTKAKKSGRGFIYHFDGRDFICKQRIVKGNFTGGIDCKPLRKPRQKAKRR
jgi:hypothetical protein